MPKITNLTVEIYFFIFRYFNKIKLLTHILVPILLGKHKLVIQIYLYPWSMHVGTGGIHQKKRAKPDAQSTPNTATICPACAS